MSWLVYILNCSDNSFYIGITNNIEKRLKAHNSGKGAKYTSTRFPVKLLLTVPTSSKSDALKLEYQLKQLTRKQKEQYIMENSEVKTNAEFILHLIKGMTKDQATEYLVARNYQVRVSSIDKKPLILTRDYHTNRINLEVENGCVVNLTIG